MIWGIYWLAWGAAVAWPVGLFFVWRAARRGGGFTPLAGVLSALLTAIWALSTYANLIEPEFLVVRRLTVESADWRGPPVRIGLISDTHVGAPHVDAARVRRVVARMNAETPDIVFLLGDYASSFPFAKTQPAGNAPQVLAGIDAFGALTPPLGTFAVFGNHDWWFDGFRIEREMRKAGVTMLENSAARAPWGGEAFWVAGLSDGTSYRKQPDFADMLETTPAGAPTIVLAHRPDRFVDLPPHIALAIAGHSHCGQVNLPFLGRLYAAGPGSERWPCGLYRERGRTLYVTGGVGESILPLRFNQPPEIVVLTLRGPRQ